MPTIVGMDKILSQVKGQKGEREFEQRQKEREQRAPELLEQARKQREQDLARGRERGEELFGQGSFGTREQDVRTADIQDIIERRRAALQGLESEEQSALRTQALENIAQGQQTQSRQLRGLQAQAGVRGGLAGAQQAQLLQQAQGQRAAVERDLLLADLAQRREALGQFEQTIGAEQERAQAERLGQLSTEFGFAQLGAAERGAVREQQIAEEQARQAAIQTAQSEGKK